MVGHRLDLHSDPVPTSERPQTVFSEPIEPDRPIGGLNGPAETVREWAGDQLNGQETVTAPNRHPQRESSGERRDRYDADDVRSLRERVAGTRWRRRLAAHRSVDHGYRVGVGIIGGLIVALGLVTIPLPGPGWLTVLAGLFVLATEFLWAERLLEFTKRHVQRWTDWVTSRPVWVRLLIAVATAAFVYGVLVISLKLLGIPDWMPGWVPLWR